MNPSARFAAWAGMFVFGVSMALLGAALPLLASRSHIDLARAGLLFFALNAAVVACALTMGPGIDCRGPRDALIAGPILVALALLITASADSFPALLAASVVMGLGGGLLNIASNTLISTLFPEPRRKNAALNRLGIFFGLGALLVPLGLAALLHRLGVQPVIWIAAAICCATSPAALMMRFPGPKPMSRSEPPLRRLRDPWIAAAALLLFLQSGNEMILTGYATTHLSRHATLPAAAWAMTVMWAAVIVCRIAAAHLARHASGQSILLGAAALTLPATLWLHAAPGFLSSAAALILTGTAMAPVFPTVMALAGARYPANTGVVFGVILACARTGAMLLPWLAGILSAQTNDTTPAIALAACAAAGILLLALFLPRLGRVRSSAAAGE